MQEKTAPVFVVATANDVSQLPPELLRAGRWDQMFFVDLPNGAEREAIWSIQIRKHGRNPADFDTVQLARASEGLTGSEIEAAFVDSLYDAFDRNTEPTDLDIARALTDFVHCQRRWRSKSTRCAPGPPVVPGVPPHPRLRSEGFGNWQRECHRKLVRQAGFLLAVSSFI